eukprot:5718305-Amphidinium_carterae.1
MGFLQPLGVTADTWVKQLGSQAHVGRKRVALLQRKRFAACFRRLSKIRPLRRAGAKVAKVVRAGLPLRAAPELFVAATPDLVQADPAHVHHREAVQRWATC